MRACVFGCDALFEERWIAVDSTGTIRVSTQARHVEHLRDTLEWLDGRRCSAWNEDTADHFAWHFQGSLVSNVP